MNIHKLAHVHKKAELGKDVVIGPFSFVGENTVIGDGTVLRNNVTIGDNTTLGSGNTIYPGAVVGPDPQDISFKGEITTLKVGDNNIIRECVTISRGTKKDSCETIVGNNNLFMACSHIGHDCIVEDNVIIANSVLLGGHIKVEKFSNLMGLVGVQPFVTIGQYSYIGGLTRVVQDVPPYMIVEGNPSKVRQVNIIGLERGGFSKETINIMRKTYKRIFRQDVLNLNKELEEIEKDKDFIPEVKTLVQFLRNRESGKNGRFRESLRKK